jgi:uncharacterized protein YbjT (DUF2867 family)
LDVIIQFVRPTERGRSSEAVRPRRFSLNFSSLIVVSFEGFLRSHQTVMTPAPDEGHHVACSQNISASKMKAILFLTLLVQPVFGFLVGTGPLSSNLKSLASYNVEENSRLHMSISSESSAEDTAYTNDFSRRSFLSFSTLSIPTLMGLGSLDPAFAEDGGKIVVFGGSGYIGSYVGKILTDKGYKVVSVSRSSPADQASKVSKILGAAAPAIDYVSLDASSDDLSSVLKDAAAVVSCVGVIGGSNQRAGNGAVNVRIADAAKAAGVSRFVYISIASDLANGPAKFILGDYIKGKAEAEAAVAKDFGPSNSLVVKPAIVAGGPPGEIRPPGPPGIKPASVEAVAKAVVAGATGAMSGKIDGNDAIAIF